MWLEGLSERWLTLVASAKYKNPDGGKNPQEHQHHINHQKYDSEHKVTPAHRLSSFALRNFSSRRAISSQIAAFSLKKNLEYNHTKGIKDQNMLRWGTVFQTKEVCVGTSLHCRQTVNKPISKGRANLSYGNSSNLETAPPLSERGVSNNFARTIRQSRVVPGKSTHMVTLIRVDFSSKKAILLKSIDTLAQPL